jgi:hypothetical protein
LSGVGSGFVPGFATRFVSGQGLARFGEEFADACHGGVGVPGRVVREEFAGEQSAIGALRDDIGEGAAAVDPELPALHVCLPDVALLRR